MTNLLVSRGTLYVAVLIIIGAGVLVARGLLDSETLSLVVGMLTGSGATAAAYEGQKRLPTKDGEG